MGAFLTTFLFLQIILLFLYKSFIVDVAKKNEKNLVENTLKYSAKGTRVFVKTYKKEAGTDQKMVLEITNTSGYEMDFEKEDIIERFSRGDKARTSEGNGLGLAIVSTYAKALGGEFDIKIDCDQFKAIVSI